MLFAVLGEARASAQTSQITSPATGATGADYSQPIRWSAVVGVEAYELVVGTSVGARNLIDSGQTLATSYPATSLPPDQIVYARIWARVGGVWRFTDSTFSGAPLFSTITYPADASTPDVAQAVTIQWTSVPHAQAYYLYVGTVAGAHDVVNTGEIQQTSFAASNLPPDRLLYARIWVKVGNVWRSSDRVFSGAMLTTRITSPAGGASGVDFDQPIQWTAVPRAQAYSLYAGSTVGANDLISSGETQATSFPASGLPPDQTVYARIYVKVNNVWRSTDTTFSGSRRTASLTYPLNASTTADLARPIQWTVVPHAQGYYLYAGTSVGAHDLINTGVIQQTSFQPATTVLPLNQTVYARIWAEVGGVWRFTDSTFRGDVLTARITSPAAGATNVDFGVPIQWTTVPHAQAYSLSVGTSAGASNVLNTGEIQQTSFLASGLPVNQTLHARIWVKVAGGWHSTDSTFTGTSYRAVITSPPNGSTSADLTQPIRWTPVSGAQAYYLYVGTMPGAKNLVDSRETQQTAWPATTLPVGQIAYARMWTKVSDVWRYVDSSFTPLPLKALLTVPADQSTVAQTSVSLQWTPRAGAQAYYLYVGTSPGARDLVDSHEIQATSYSRSGLPVGRTIYVRIWTKLGGVWQFGDSTFTIAPSTFLVQASDLQYNGAFRLPSGDYGSPRFHGFNYGGSAIAFNSLNGSLYMVGHSQDQLVAEISVPAIRTGSLSSLATAGVLQNFFDPLEGHLNDVNPSDPNSKLIGGLLPLADRLAISAYSYYDGLGTQVKSHFVRPLTLTTSGAVQGPFQLDTLAGMVSGYMTHVPANWQEALGGPIFTGNCCLGVVSRTSYGPSVSTMNPDDLGRVEPVPVSPLVQYSSAHTTLGAWDGASPLFNGTTQVTGVVFPEDTSSVLFFGRRGLGAFCYGPGTADSALAGELADGGVDRYCLDPADGSKGTHAYPYVYSVWAYNALDLALVRAGLKQPWEPVPYAVWNLDLPYANGGGLLVGAAYDPVQNHIFVSQGFGDGTLPVVHVFTVPRN